MGTSLEYDRLVEGFRAKISGNVSSVKMTEAETAKEIAEVTEGVFVPSTTETGPAIPNDSGSVAKEGFPQPKRRGRPPGSRNKPKV